MDMQKQKKIRAAISEGISSWLTFEKLCGREGLFSERYLAMPMAQILRDNVTGTITGEYTHPVLAIPGTTGRPPQLDFVVEENGKLVLCVETKWASTQSVSVKDVVWDCVRLELAAHHFKCDAIFVLAGTRDRIDTILSSPSFNPKKKDGKKSLVMSLHGKGRTSVTIKAAKGIVSQPLHKILNEYPSIKFATTYICEHGTQIPKHGETNSYTAAVWHIRPEMKQKRHTFVTG